MGRQAAARARSPPCCRCRSRSTAALAGGQRRDRWVLPAGHALVRAGAGAAPLARPTCSTISRPTPGDDPAAPRRRWLAAASAGRRAGRLVVGAADRRRALRAHGPHGDGRGSRIRRRRHRARRGRPGAGRLRPAAVTRRARRRRAPSGDAAGRRSRWASRRSCRWASSASAAATWRAPGPTCQAGRVPATAEAGRAFEAPWNAVSQGYFAAMGVRLLAGRTFTRRRELRRRRPAGGDPRRGAGRAALAGRRRAGRAHPVRDARRRRHRLRGGRHRRAIALDALRSRAAGCASSCPLARGAARPDVPPRRGPTPRPRPAPTPCGRRSARRRRACRCSASRTFADHVDASIEFWALGRASAALRRRSASRR